MGLVRTETVELSDSDIKEAIANWLNDKYGDGPFWQAEQVTISAGLRTEGMGTNEHQAAYCSITATRET